MPRDSESLLLPRYLGGSTCRSTDEEPIVIIDGDEIGISRRLSVSPHDDAPRKRDVHWEVTGVPETESANPGQRITMF